VRGLAGFLGRIRREFELVMKVYPDTPAIARRMFATNSFDGLLSALGVSVGGFSPDVKPEFLALGIIGGSLSMGVLSGVVGVYLSERAERVREVRELEKKVAKSLRNSVYWKAANVIPIYIALWSGVGIIFFPLLVAAPYLAAASGIISMTRAFYASIGVALTLMALIGVYLARISGSSQLMGAVKGVAIGVAGILVVSAAKSLLGLAVLG